MLTFLLLLFLGSASEAEMFRSKTFLMWDDANQSFYIEASVGMASLIAARMDKAQGKCIDDWYYADENAANASIRKIMTQYPENHPRGIILAVVQKKCGDIGRLG